jgi:hypothetical protein
VGEYEGGGWAWQWEPTRPLARRDRRLLDWLGVGIGIAGGEATVDIQDAEELISEVSRLGFEPWAAVRRTWRRHYAVADAATAVNTWLGAIRPHGNHWHWPGEALVLRHPTDSGFVFSSDLDGQVIQLLCWGDAGQQALAAVLRLAATRLRESVRRSVNEIRLRHIALYFQVSHRRARLLYRSGRLPEPVEVDERGPRWDLNELREWADREGWAHRS